MSTDTPIVRRCNSNTTSGQQSVQTCDQTVVHSNKRILIKPATEFFDEEEEEDSLLAGSTTHNTYTSELSKSMKECVVNQHKEMMGNSKNSSCTVENNDLEPVVMPSSSWSRVFCCGHGALEMTTTTKNADPSDLSTAATESESLADPGPDDLDYDTFHEMDASPKEHEQEQERDEESSREFLDPALSKDAMMLESIKQDLIADEMALKKRRRRAGVLKPGGRLPMSPRKDYTADGAGLDIVMELQMEESTKMGKPKSRSKRNTIPKPSASPRNTRTSPQRVFKKPIMSLQTAASNGSIFSFRSETPNSPPKIQVSGPANGTFENIAEDEDDVIDKEVLQTYESHRISGVLQQKVVSGIKCNLPLYHNRGSKNPASMKKGLHNVCSEPISSKFQVRGETYLNDDVKIKSDESIFSTLGCDNIIKKKGDSNYLSHNVCKGANSYLNRLRIACDQANVEPPFLLVINFVVPWGNTLSYYHRPDATSGPFNDNEADNPFENLWRSFLTGDQEYRTKTLKFIPNLQVGPWFLKKMVGSKPCIMGNKLPTSFYGSVEEGYLEICMDVTKGGKIANSICTSCASKCSLITIDLAFLLEGKDEEELPEQLLSVIRLHHVHLKKGTVIE